MLTAVPCPVTPAAGADAGAQRRHPAPDQGRPEPALAARQERRPQQVLGGHGAVLRTHHRQGCRGWRRTVGLEMILSSTGRGISYGALVCDT